MIDERKIINFSEHREKKEDEKAHEAERLEVARLIEKADLFKQRFNLLEEKFPGAVFPLEARKEYEVLYEEIENFLEEIEPTWAILEGEYQDAGDDFDSVFEDESKEREMLEKKAIQKETIMDEFNEMETSVVQIKNKIEEKLGKK
jgi:hypothetical protein